MQLNDQKTGRPRDERLSDEDVAYIKAQVADSNESRTLVAAQFHREVYAEAVSGAYKGVRLPGDVESVKSAFARAFKPDAQKRQPLPPLYWRILEALYGITRDSVPSRSRAVEKTPAAPHAPSQGTSPTAAPSQIRSLAVMPLLNLSGDPGQDYFVDGITELLCDELGTVSALQKVTSRTTIMQYKATTKTLPQIAAELGVDAVVEGSVQRENNSVLVSVHLIDGRADRQLWAANYEREINGLLKLKTELARAITSSIRVQLTPDEQARQRRSKPVPPAALDAYLKGRFEYWSPAVHWSHLQRAQDYYRQAIGLDPTCARAYAGLAEIYIARLFRRGERTRPLLSLAHDDAGQALALDDSLPEAHTTAAWVRMMRDWDWTGAEAEFRCAIRLNPSYSLAHTWYGHLLDALGRFDEAAIEMRRGQELDPRSPLIYMFLSEPAYLMGDYDQALEIAKGLLKSNPTCLYLYFILAKVHLQQGKFEQAIAECRKLPAQFWEVEVDPVVARAYALSGRRAEALKALEELKGMAQGQSPSAYAMAGFHTALGETDQAVTWLQRAYEECSAPMYRLGVEPAFYRLHNDPRFQALLAKMNLRTGDQASRLPA